MINKYKYPNTLNLQLGSYNQIASNTRNYEIIIPKHTSNVSNKHVCSHKPVKAKTVNSAELLFTAIYTTLLLSRVTIQLLISSYNVRELFSNTPMTKHPLHKQRHSKWLNLRGKAVKGNFSYITQLCCCWLTLEPSNGAKHIKTDIRWDFVWSHLQILEHL